MKRPTTTLVRVERIACGCADDGLYMARDFMGRPLCTRETAEAAMQAGLAMVEKERGALCARTE